MKNKTRDNEFYSRSELNNFKEFNNSYKESFSPFENIKVMEDATSDLKEENDKNIVEEKMVKVKKPVVFKDKIIESTGPLKTIISASACTVAAATVATTVFLTKPPSVDNVRLQCGNDYVEYALDISVLDPESSYKIEISNSSFSYQEDIDANTADETGFINGYINGLKPNRKYDFKLKRDNGEIGGYSDFYTQTFYTLKAPNPTVLFDFSYDEINSNLDYNVHISDYYEVCSNSYLVHYTCDNDRVEIPLSQLDYSSNIALNSDKTIYFDVYSTIDDNDTLLGSYQYDFNQFDSYMQDGTIVVSGHVEDKYKKASKYLISVLTYDENDDNTYIERIDKEVLPGETIEANFKPTKLYKRYKYVVSVKNVELYTSEMRIANLIDVNYGSMTFNENGLVVSIDKDLSNSHGYIVSTQGDEVPLVFTENTIFIPFLDENDNRYYYSNYRVVIDGAEYTIPVDKSLLNVQNARLYMFDNQLSVTMDNYLSLYDDSNCLHVIIKQSNTVIGEGDVDEENYSVNIPTRDDIVVESNTYVIEYVMRDESGNNYQETKTNGELTLVDTIHTSFKNTDGTISLSLAESNTYTATIEYYNSNGMLIDNDTIELSNANTTYTKSVKDTVSYVVYKFFSDSELIYASRKYEIFNLVLGQQEITLDGLKIPTSGLKKDTKVYLLDTDSSSRYATVNDGYFVIPTRDSNTGNRIIYNTNEIVFDNGFETKHITYTLEDNQFIVNNVAFENSYSMNGLQFDVNAFSSSDVLSIAVEVYDGDTLLTNEYVDYNTIYGSCSCLFNFLDDSNSNIDMTIKISLAGENNHPLSDKVFTYEILAKDRQMTSQEFNCNSPNPSDILCTSNGDGTIKLSIPINFSAEDPDLLVRIYLNDEYYDTRDQNFEIDNLEDKPYSVRYMLIKQSTSMIMVFMDVTPSGMINED